MIQLKDNTISENVSKKGREMGDKLKLTVQERTLHGKKVTKLRQDGIVPAVIYGPDIEPASVQVEEGVMSRLYRQAGTYTPVYLEVGSKKHIAMIKEVDRDPVRGSIRHVSFHAVNAKDPVTAEVPIHLDGEGESEAEKAGLMVLQTIDKIEVKALPADLPDALLADIRALKEAGEKLLVSDLPLPKNVELVEHETGHGDDDEDQHTILDLVVASVWEPSALQAANEAAAGTAEDEAEVESDNGEAEEPAASEENADDKKE